MLKSKIVTSFFVIFSFFLILYSSSFLIKNKASIFGRAFGKKADIVVDVGSAFEVDRSFVWKNLAQGGEEDGRMLYPVLSYIRRLSPRYIRLDHVFDYYGVVKGREGDRLILDWTNLDLTLSDILTSGAKPFLSLSYMPPLVSGGDVTDLPLNWSDWEFLVRSLVEHVSGKDGLAISDVYYEVWNEPDLFGKFMTKGKKNYLDLYYYAHRGAVSARNVLPFKIGGPATTSHYKNWLNHILDFVSSRSLRFDFYSWHTYSPSVSKFESDLSEIEEILSGRNLDLELIISESGITGENDKRYDSYFSAIHNLAVVSSLEGKLDKFFVFEIKDGLGGEKYWGRWGLLTHERWGEPFEKPRYRSVEFLNRMQGNFVNVAGLGSWVKGFAKKDGEIIRLLLVNYDTKGRNYESVPVKFVNLQPGNYVYRRFSFLKNREEGRSNFSVDLSGVWQTRESLDPNSAFIIELSPLTR